MLSSFFLKTALPTSTVKSAGLKIVGRQFFNGSFLSNVPQNPEKLSSKSSNLGVKFENKPKESAFSYNTSATNRNFQYACNNYTQICQHLGLSNSDSLKLTSAEFINFLHCIHLMPKVALWLKNEDDFVDKHLRNWWLKVIKLHWKSLYACKCNVVLRNLYALDLATNGKVVEQLSWKSIDEVLIQPQLGRKLNLMIWDFESCFENISLFANDKKYEQIFQTVYSKGYEKIFWQQVKAYLLSPPHRDPLMHALGHVMLIGHKCRFNFPISSFNMPNFIDFSLKAPICRAVNARTTKNHFRFNNCAQIGEAFLNYELDIDRFAPNFWAQWFKMFIDLYKMSKFANFENDLNLNKNSLDFQKNPKIGAKNFNLCLKIALKLKKFREFEEIKEKWIENMEKLIENLNAEERKSTINLLNEKQIPENLHRIVDVLCKVD